MKHELSEMRKAMEDLTSELRKTNLAIRESLKLTSDTIKEMSDTFSKTLGGLKSLGIDSLIPDLFKKKKQF